MSLTRKVQSHKIKRRIVVYEDARFIILFQVHTYDDSKFLLVSKSIPIIPNHIEYLIVIRTCNQTLVGNSLYFLTKNAANSKWLFIYAYIHSCSVLPFQSFTLKPNKQKKKNQTEGGSLDHTIIKECKN